MEDTGPCGVSQAPRRPLPGRGGGAVAALSGDVDADGQIVDALTARLDRAICDTTTISRRQHLALVREVVSRRRLCVVCGGLGCEFCPAAAVAS